MKIDVAIIPRDKLSYLVETVKSLSSIRGDINNVILFDVGYPNIYLEKAIQVLDSFDITFIKVVYPGFVLANRCLSDLPTYADSSWVLILENDCQIIDMNIKESLIYLNQSAGKIGQPCIIEKDSQTIHYNPPVSYIEKTDYGLISKVIRNPREGYPSVNCVRRIFHIEKHCLFVDLDFLRQEIPLEDFLSTRSHWDLSFRAFFKKAKIYFLPNNKVKFSGSKINIEDVDYFNWRWNILKAIKSNEYIRKKWNVMNYKSSVLWLEEMLDNVNEI